MNSTDVRERELLLEWAKENEEPEVFGTENDRNLDSYYIDRCADTGEIMEYYPENICDFIKQFQMMWGKERDEKVMRIVAVAALKARQPSIEQKEEKKEPVSKIPEYIYTL